MTDRMTTAEAANHYNVSERTIRRWINNNKLTAEWNSGQWFIINNGNPNDRPNDRRTSGHSDRQSDDRLSEQLQSQLQSEVKHLREQLDRRDEQVDHLQKLLAISQQSIQQLTQQNQLLLEDVRQPKTGFWQRFKAVFVTESG